MIHIVVILGDLLLLHQRTLGVERVYHPFLLRSNQLGETHMNNRTMVVSVVLYVHKCNAKSPVALFQR